MGFLEAADFRVSNVDCQKGKTGKVIPNEFAGFFVGQESFNYVSSSGTKPYELYTVLVDSRTLSHPNEVF